MKARIHVLALAVLAFVLTGCVSQVELDRLKTQYRQCQETVVELQARLDEKNAEIIALRESRHSADADVMARLRAAESQRDELASQLARAEAQIKELMGRTPVALPQELDQALLRLAEQHPDLMEYDRRLGMVKFRSDLTFDLGSDSVKPAAAATLRQLANILTSPVAAGYEARIIGHTDNVPIQRVKDQHPTNWHLSAHRAIAVKNELEKEGVNPGAMMVGGYSEYRPIVPNGARGAEANRRVEIFLVASSARMDMTTTNRSSAPAPAPAPAVESDLSDAPEMLK